MNHLMKNSVSVFLLALLFAPLVGCDSSGALSKERAEKTYRAAMNDYQAGRLKAARAGFEKTCALNPANTSARFQLACLLQDSAHDYLGAYCAYREYLLQSPESEKAPLAQMRLVACEREVAAALAKKYATEETARTTRLAEERAASLAKAEAEVARLKKALEASEQACVTLTKENARLKKYMSDAADETRETAPVSHDDLRSAREMLDDDANASKTARDEADAAKALVESDRAIPPPVLDQPSDAKARRDEARATAKKGESAPKVTRPETYVVQEGDTLYQIAIRFYGRASLWNRIREANRATISTDGRLKKGQKIILPKID